MMDWKDQVSQVLNNITSSIADFDPRIHVPPLFDVLFSAVEALSEKDFDLTISTLCQSHLLHGIFLEDPYTRRSFEKPRGFSGDARLIDYLYGYNGPTVADTARGSGLFSHFMTAPSSDAVRFRRAYLASQIDEVCDRYDGAARIASIACGHLREVAFSTQVSFDKFDKIYALDQDKKALKEIKTIYCSNKICTVHESIKHILSGRLNLSELHLVYAAGLYDYLNKRIAERLTERLFDFLLPGGSLIYANFIPTTYEKGYMKAFMDWHLIYRTPQEAVDLASKIDPSLIVEKETFIDPMRRVVYVKITKKDH